MQIEDSTFLLQVECPGLGAATARLLVENGAVALADVDEEAVEQMASQIGSGGLSVPTSRTKRACSTRLIRRWRPSVP